MAVVPSESCKRLTELTGAEAKVWVCLCEHRHQITGKCNPSHETISLETGVDYTHISTAKNGLREKGWIRTWGKRDCELLVGQSEFEKLREARLKTEERKQAAKFGKTKDGAGSIFEKTKDGSPQVGNFQTLSLKNSKIINKDDPVVNDPVDAAAATAATPVDHNAWKSETVDAGYIEQLKTSGVFSPQTVSVVWTKLSFLSGQRGTPVTKGELWGWCARERPTQAPLPNVGAEVVQFKSPAGDDSPGATRDCDSSCERCHGSQMETASGKGARRCPNRTARAAGLERREGEA